MKISKKAQNRFYYIKKLINNDYDVKEFIDGFYFNSKAIKYVEKLNKNFFINNYYNLTTSDLLLDVYENDNITQVKNYYFKTYQDYYAKAWLENFLFVLEG